MNINLKVLQAEAYRYGAMGSSGNANNMLMRQFQFPAEFDRHVDVMMSADSDRLLMWDYDGFRKTLEKFLGKGEGAIGEWVRRSWEGKTEATDEQVMAFIIEALKAKEQHPDVVFTGWRVTGTVHRGNGFPIYTLSLFANRSGVAVYSDESAPNVEEVRMDKLFGVFGLRSTCRSEWGSMG